MYSADHALSSSLFKIQIKAISKPKMTESRQISFENEKIVILTRKNYFIFNPSVPTCPELYSLGKILLIETKVGHLECGLATPGS